MMDIFETQLAVPTGTAARMLSVSPGYLAKLRTQGLGPRFHKLPGNRVLYTPKDLAEWLDVWGATTTTERAVA